MGGKSWTKEEIEVLVELYPTEDRSVVLGELPCRTWQAIWAKTCKLGIKRTKGIGHRKF